MPHGSRKFIAPAMAVDKIERDASSYSFWRYLYALYFAFSFLVSSSTVFIHFLPQLKPNLLKTHFNGSGSVLKLPVMLSYNNYRQSTVNTNQGEFMDWFYMRVTYSMY